MLAMKDQIGEKTRDKTLVWGKATEGDPNHHIATTEAVAAWVVQAPNARSISLRSFEASVSPK